MLRRRDTHPEPRPPGLRRTQADRDLHHGPLRAVPGRPPDRIPRPGCPPRRVSRGGLQGRRGKAARLGQAPAATAQGEGLSQLPLGQMARRRPAAGPGLRPRLHRRRPQPLLRPAGAHARRQGPAATGAGLLRHHVHRRPRHRLPPRARRKPRRQAAARLRGLHRAALSPASPGGGRGAPRQGLRPGLGIRPRGAARAPARARPLARKTRRRRARPRWPLPRRPLGLGQAGTGRARPHPALGIAGRGPARLPVRQDGRARRDGGAHGPGGRQAGRRAARAGPARQHAHPLHVRQRRQLRAARPGRRPRPRGSAGFRRDVPLPRARLGLGRQHALPTAQDLGPRGRHLHPAHRALARRHGLPGRHPQGHRTPGRPRPHPARARRPAAEGRRG